jgi:hypothetical protein
MDSKCLACHGRQAKEIALGLSDVHRDAGFTCTTCHSESDAHGDGGSYSSLLSDGAIKASCVGCHDTATLPAVPHQNHLAKVDCSGCHVKNTISCYNCHFEKGSPAGVFDWKILVKKNGKVHAGNMMAAVSTSGPKQTFTVIAPYFGHTIYKPDVGTVCDECHKNDFVAEYNNTGTMTLTWWNNGLQHYGGSDPVMIPDDWATSLKIAFVKQDTSGTWIHYKDTKDVTQMLFGETFTSFPPQF